MIGHRQNLLTRSISFVAFTATALLLCSTLGCNDASLGVSIQGQVSYRGKLISSGTLTFYPTKGRPISAVISLDGDYSCQLPPGKHRVTVVLGVDLPAGWKEGDAIPASKLRLPPKYTSRVRTPLAVTVVDGQSEAVDFSLK